MKMDVFVDLDVLEADLDVFVDLLVGTKLTSYQMGWLQSFHSVWDKPITLKDMK